ncbi:MAG: TIGR03619 family F420-dependent LLM class oxidoreductase [Candidatus Dadabacteria bacterium]|nr:MAG: TIGR03619 family F420-dependent LLM class oxidoreductase [Candidatus Dadabacteria bacterium]
MKFTVSIAMTSPEHYIPLAQTAEECGFHAIALPDSIFYSEEVSAAYPYTADGSRMWNEDTPFIEPMVGAAAMSAATKSIFFYTSVIKVGVRNPVLLAKQVGSLAVISGERFGLGAGIGWLPEEFKWCGTEFRQRGKRVDESLEIIQGLLTGDWFEYHGEFFDIGRIKMQPAPKKKVPIYIGGHSKPAFRRAVRFGDGWASAMMKFDDLKETIATLKQMLADAGRGDDPFEFQAVCIDRFGVDGYKQQREIGVTDVITIPWVMYGVPNNADLQAKQDAIRRFADDIVAKVNEQ